MLQWNRSSQGKLDSEERSSVDSFAHRGHATAVQLGEVAHDGEAQAEPAVRPRRAAIRLPERIENVG